MQLIVRNKWISLKGSSYVKDESGKDVMKVRGKFWTLTYKKFIEDLDGNVKYIVRYFNSFSASVNHETLR